MNGGNSSALGDSHSRSTEVSCSPWPRIEDNKVLSLGIFLNDSFSFSIPLILAQIVLITSTSRVLNFLFRPFNQLRITSDIIAGFLLGPAFLGRILPGYRALFPEREMMINLTMGTTGVMFYSFLVSVKMDPMIVVRSGRKSLIIGLLNTLPPILLMSLAAFALRSHIPSPMAQSYFFIFLVLPLNIANFPVISDALAELKLLNSELGRLALSTSMVNTAVAWSIMTLFIFVKQLKGGLDKGFKMMISMLAMVALIIFVFRPWMLWIVRRTPKGQRVGEFHVFAILMCVLGFGLLSEIIGATNTNGMVALGLVIPEGPPLGAAIIERIELFSNEIILPILFANAGRHVRLEAFVHWRSWTVLMFLLGLIYVTKFVWTFVPAMYCCKLPARKAFLLGLILNFRGLINLVTYHGYVSLSLMDEESFSIVVFSFLVVTAIVTPVVVKQYQPLAENQSTNCPTIQNLKPHTQLRLLAFVQNDEPIPCIINLLEASSPATTAAPLFACVIHLDEQLGRSDSTLIAHKNSKGFINPTNMGCLHNAFLYYEQSKNGMVEVRPYTSISPFHNVSQEICALAAQENVAFVIIPLSRRNKINVGLVEDHALRNEIPLIRAQAPCSVGLLVHNGLEEPLLNSPSKFQQHIGVFFWSGPDYREALAYASLMARHVGVNLTVTQFLVASEEVLDKTQASLDDELMAAFQLEYAGNEKVVVQQIAVEDMEHAISVIQSIGSGGGYDLVVVGLRFGWYSPVLKGLEEWCENPELGVVGDALASFDFERCFSILVVQQKT